jgi:hypothetical protein
LGGRSAHDPYRGLITYRTFLLDLHRGIAGFESSRDLNRHTIDPDEIMRKDSSANECVGTTDPYTR